MDNLTKKEQPDRSKINILDVQTRRISRGRAQGAWRGGHTPLTNRGCTICFGIGRVCENHPRRAWSEKLSCQCGAGMPCQWNQIDRLREAVVDQVKHEETDRRSRCSPLDLLALPQR